jgi:DNA-binding PadR family transcriptional regulator
MSTRLVILGMLRGRPLHGYELKQNIEEQMGDWASIAFGSIYFALDKLEAEGFIAKAAVEQQGERPVRTVYQITPAGEVEFMSLLRKTWSQVDWPHYDLDIALFFMQNLSRDEIAGYLRARIAGKESALQSLAQHEGETMQDPHVPGFARAIFDHSRVHLQAELDWTRALLEKVKEGIYP